ncbi:MAG: hypothetical protein KKE77_10790 [Alphaproteobacteria bacterium]|nr:hypothetical protein [Alphaproteobacteria bacterium]
MTDTTTPAKDQPRPWEPGFFAALRSGSSVAAAARLAGIHPTTVYLRASSNPAFLQRYEATRLAVGRVVGRRRGARTVEAGWQDRFLEALAETSNVTAAAWRAKVVPGRAYACRRENPAFAARWLAALIEGYQHLEMEVLGYLRDPEPTRKMDVASALRLLAAHRETVARERAFREEEEDEQAVFDRIDAFIDDMRHRRAANALILAPDETALAAPETAPEPSLEGPVHEPV